MFPQAGFSIDMTVKITTQSGPVGTPITVDIKGIGWRSLFNSWDLLYDNHFTGWLSAVTTGGSATFTIPATGRPGLHVLEGRPGLTFPYRNMQRFRARPTALGDPVRVTAGPPVLHRRPSSRRRGRSATCRRRARSWPRRRFPASRRPVVCAAKASSRARAISSIGPA